MRVAFVGKGGSGKTTVAALFARTLAAKGLPVLAIDADINQHLGVSLGLAESDAATLPALGGNLGRLKEHLRARNPRIASADHMLKTTPPGRGSRLIRFDAPDPELGELERDVDGIRLLAAGPLDEADLGIACYHSKVGAVEMLLNHLVDGPGEYVVVDMTAGADAFASGLFTRFDLTVLVAEPTRKAVSVYRQYEQQARGYNVALAVIGNKICSPDDVDFLRQQTGDHLCTWLDHSDYVRALERGPLRAIDELELENRSALDEIRIALDSRTRDWRTYQRHTNEFHRRNAAAWGNTRTGTDLTSQIDPDFDLAEAVATARDRRVA